MSRRTWIMTSIMRCPICRMEFDPTGATTLPFCSERCRTVDLGRWLGEKYSLPTVPDPDQDDQPGSTSSEAESHSSHPHERTL